MNRRHRGIIQKAWNWPEYTLETREKYCTSKVLTPDQSTKHTDSKLGFETIGPMMFCTSLSALLIVNNTAPGFGETLGGWVTV